MPGDAVQIGVMPAGSGQVNFMIMDPEEDVGYIVAEGGVYKFFPRFPVSPTREPLLFKAATGAQVGYQLGFGVTPGAGGPLTILMPPFGASGAADKLWKFTPGTGWAGITLPKAAWYWWGLWASPFNPTTWLLLGSNSSATVEANVGSGYTVSGGNVLSADASASPLWLTTDGGANWSQVTLPTSGKTVIHAGINVCWSDSDAGVFFVAAFPMTGSGKIQKYLLREEARKKLSR